MPDVRPVIAILGPGTVGGALARSLHATGWPVTIGGRNVRTAKLLADQVAATGGNLEQAARSARVVLLTVSDDAIGPLCRTLTAAGVWNEENMVLHCSGALDSSVLRSAQQAGASVGSWHPLQTFPADEAVASLADVPFFAEGDGKAITMAKRLTDALGGTFHEVTADGKALYHAAAVMACNCVSTLLESAEALMDRAGIGPEDARAAMAPLVRRTVENAARRGGLDTLTGPIVRGDAETVRRHLAAMRAAGLGELAELYRAVGKRTAELARRRGGDVSGVLEALNEPTNDPTEREADA
jgi:predicted short-subunit dehydrogenase-like oxidoreductase (DUF2520 family)